MTLMLILGGIAALYLISILFRLAAYALPAFAGIAVAMLLLDRDVGHLPAIVGGFMTGVAVLLLGQIMMAFLSSPVLRLGVALMYAIPAGFAGYQAVRGVAGLFIDSAAVVFNLSICGALATSVAALRGLALELPARTQVSLSQPSQAASTPAD